MATVTGDPHMTCSRTMAGASLEFLLVRHVLRGAIIGTSDKRGLSQLRHAGRHI